MQDNPLKRRKYVHVPNTSTDIRLRTDEIISAIRTENTPETTLEIYTTIYNNIHKIKQQYQVFTIIKYYIHCIFLASKLEDKGHFTRSILDIYDLLTYVDWNDSSVPNKLNNVYKRVKEYYCIPKKYMICLDEIETIIKSGRIDYLCYTVIDLLNTPNWIFIDRALYVECLLRANIVIPDIQTKDSYLIQAIKEFDDECAMLIQCKRIQLIRADNNPLGAFMILMSPKMYYLIHRIYCMKITPATEMIINALYPKMTLGNIAKSVFLDCIALCDLLLGNECEDYVKRVIVTRKAHLLYDQILHVSNNDEYAYYALMIAELCYKWSNLRIEEFSIQRSNEWYQKVMDTNKILNSLRQQAERGFMKTSLALGIYEFLRDGTEDTDYTNDINYADSIEDTSDINYADSMNDVNESGITWSELRNASMFVAEDDGDISV